MKCLIRINFRAYHFLRTLNLDKFSADLFFAHPTEIIEKTCKSYFKISIKISNDENVNFENFRADLFLRTSLLCVIIVQNFSGTVTVSLNQLET